MSISFNKLTAHIGARVSGVDITTDLSDAEIEEIRAGLLEHKALVFDAPGLTVAGQEGFAGRFGPITTSHPTVPGDPTINILDVDSASSKANEWHTDVTFVHTPPAITTLRAVTLPPYGGETLIANSAAAYRALPAELRAFADTLWSVHSNLYDYADVAADRELSEQAKSYRDVFESLEFETRHPIVRVHPETGEKGLYIGGFVRRIEGLSGNESRDILRILQSYVTRPEHIVRVHWQAGQFVAFDNRITQHYAIDNYDDLPRKLTRVTVAGDVPVSVSGERSTIIKGDASHYTPADSAVAA
ncbi:TauD/TfdA dioxygenase family protein [Nocardioides sp. Kera G14]|uniref:TauD/TfdA dioxygenase family protein n=1 Tax=Nocardioides sp. Kera G14 TaxID=2884264 RepID=UPI001D12BD9A|nr:TauD/TfdA family dioxygenase [Nocardioides sp. Kera G14]UDY23056.1 TauD/TfdA family dioxygenase [Nocardioides sp. Kera G14]